MKKAFTILLCLTLVLGLSACGGNDDSSAKEYSYEIAFITPSAEVSIDDGAYVENTWEGVRSFAEKSDKTYKYYEPEQGSEDAILSAIDEAVSADAKTIVGYGQTMEKAFTAAANQYVDQKFLLIGGEADTAKSGTISNAAFSDAEAGYLAGYAAVTEGYETIGYLAEKDSKESKDYGYGFMQGCQAAAVQWGHTVEIGVSYDGARAQQTAKNWYESGAEMISVYGSDNLTTAVAAEAKKLNRVVFAGGPAKLDDTITAAVVKDCRKAAREMLEAVYGITSGSYGDTMYCNAVSGHISLIWKEEEFSLFLQEDYDKLLEKMQAENFKLLNSADVKSEKELIQKGNLYKISLL